MPAVAKLTEPTPDPEAGTETGSAVTPRRRRRAGDSPAIEREKLAFLRLVSHELRTPLNSILGFSEILSAELYGPLGAPQYREYADIIRGSGKKLLKLVNQVLELGRLEGLELERAPRGPGARLRRRHRRRVGRLHPRRHARGHRRR